MGSLLRRLFPNEGTLGHLQDREWSWKSVSYLEALRSRMYSRHCLQLLRSCSQSIDRLQLQGGLDLSKAYPSFHRPSHWRYWARGRGRSSWLQLLGCRWGQEYSALWGPLHFQCRIIEVFALSQSSLQTELLLCEPSQSLAQNHLGKVLFNVLKKSGCIPGELLNWTLRKDLRAPFVPDCKSFITVTLINTVRFGRLFALAR